MAVEKKSGTLITVARIITLLAVIGISLYIFSIRNQAQQLAVYGFPGIFLLSFLSYATVLLPAPGVAVVFTMGAVFHPILVAIAAGTGAALGELTGYMAGFSGRTVLERVELHETLTKWMQNNGAITILLLSAIPNPFFDIAGVAAGALKLPLPKFLLWCWIGEIIKMLLFAYVGGSSINWLINL